MKAEVDLTADEGEGKPALKIKLGGKTIGVAPKQEAEDGGHKPKAKLPAAAAPKSKAAPKAKASKEAAGKPASRKRQRKAADDEDNVCAPATARVAACRTCHAAPHCPLRESSSSQGPSLMHVTTQYYPHLSTPLCTHVRHADTVHPSQPCRASA